jgi:hypothetical protein
LLIAGAAALLLVVFVGIRYFQFQQDGGDVAAVAQASAEPSDAPSAAGSSAPQAAATKKPEPARTAAPKQTLEISVTAPSWLLVKVDGAQVLQGIMPAGTRKSYHGSSAFVRAGNAGGVTLTLNGKDLGAMGHSGDVIQRNFTLASETQ